MLVVSWASRGHVGMELGQLLALSAAAAVLFETLNYQNLSMLHVEVFHVDESCYCIIMIIMSHGAVSRERQCIPFVSLQLPGMVHATTLHTARPLTACCLLPWYMYMTARCTQRMCYMRGCAIFDLPASRAACLMLLKDFYRLCRTSTWK